MAKTRALVQRRKAIRNIRKITRTMELIATAKFRKALTRAVEADAFTRKIAELAADLSAHATNITHPLLEKREHVKKAIVLVLTSNRGLCGGYNGSILREATGRLRQLQADNVAVQLELSGKRAIAYFRFQGTRADQTFTQFEDKPTFGEVDVLANRYIADYIAGRVDRVDVVYMKFINAAHQKPVAETLLPLTHAAPEARKAKAPAAPVGSPVEYEFVPDAKSILEEILPMSFKVQLFKCFLDAAVSEQIARRVAMTAATENSDEIIKTLSQQYNRARQAQITKELAEVIGGAEALK
jgi:F-type H+-transporting ATPase subunit gamma